MRQRTPILLSGQPLCGALCPVCCLPVVCDWPIPAPGSLTLLVFSYLSDLFFCFVFLLWRFFVLFLSLNVNIPQVLFPPFSFNKFFFEVSCIYGINYGLLVKGFPTPTFKYLCYLGPHSLSAAGGNTSCFMLYAAWNELYSPKPSAPLLGLKPSALGMLCKLPSLSCILNPVPWEHHANFHHWAVYL